MKLKKIESIAKSGACIRIAKGNDGRLWIGDGSAVYFIGGLKDISKEQLLFIFDVPEEKWDLFNVLEYSATYNDDEISEQLIDRQLKLELYGRGTHLILFESKQGLICVNSKYLKPIDDEKKCTFYLRDGGKTIAVKRGMFLIALIATFDISGAEDIKDDIGYIAESLDLRI